MDIQRRDWTNEDREEGVMRRLWEEKDSRNAREKSGQLDHEVHLKQKHLGRKIHSFELNGGSNT